MNPTQAVVLTQMLSFAIFWLAGDEAKRKANNSLRRLQGKPMVAASSATEPGPNMTVGVAAGWAVMFLTLIVFADIEATAELSKAFAWLILVSIALAYGEDAFHNITAVLNANAAYSSSSGGGGGGGGGGKKRA